MKHTKSAAFPQNFLWGASISAFQAEGAASEDGRTPISMELHTLHGVTDHSVASDFYHRYREDIALMAELGLKTFRFSIAWSRILPQGVGAVNPKGLEFYNNVINTCLSYGIEPLVTMCHFDMPLALEQRGGWGNSDSVQWFTEYAEILFRNYGDRVKYWLTINEQNVMIFLAERFHTLVIPQGCKNTVKEIYQQNHRMLVAQAKAFALCHQLVPGGKIGPAPNISYVYPASCKPSDTIAAENYNALRNWLYLDAAVYGRYNEIVWAWLQEHDAAPEFAPGDAQALQVGKPDFIGFNYYNTLTCEEDDGSRPLTQATDQQTARGEPGMFRGCPNPYLETSEYGWEIDPVGLRVTIREIYGRYHLPMLITENGIGLKEELTPDGKVHDEPRIYYLRQHIRQISLAIQDGCEMLGYCPWSAIDLISTHQGFQKRYGFVFVNRDEFDLKDLARYKKDSFDWYRTVIQSNGRSLEES